MPQSKLVPWVGVGWCPFDLGGLQSKGNELEVLVLLWPRIQLHYLPPVHSQTGMLFKPLLDKDLTYLNSLFLCYWADGRMAWEWGTRLFWKELGSVPVSLVLQPWLAVTGASGSPLISGNCHKDGLGNLGKRFFCFVLFFSFKKKSLSKRNWVYGSTVKCILTGEALGLTPDTAKKFKKITLL